MFVLVNPQIQNIVLFGTMYKRLCFYMADMYKIIDDLLRARGISGAKMSADLGMSRSFMTELRKGRAKSVKLETAQKIADYFGVPVGMLLGDESAPRTVSDDDIKFALFGGDGEITDAMFQEVKAFAAFVKQREQNKKE